MPGNPFGEEPGDWFPSPSSTNPFDSNYARPVNDLAFATPQARTLASQQRALASIGHSEQVGISTLEELAEQGEKLDRAEQRLHQISELQKDSQRQISALNSWWKSWFSKKPSTQFTAESVGTKTEAKSSGNRTAPASAYLSETIRQPPQTSPLSPFGHQNAQPSQFDANMDVMSSGMARLRDMATAMNAELKAQNKQLERMDPVLSRVTDNTTMQNRQMSKLLGVKPPR